MANDATIRTVVAAGVPGTQMPPFAQSKGGMLTDAQIDALVHGIRAWALADVSIDGLPPYAAQSPGDPQRGAVAYATFCSSCHGSSGQGGKGGSSIANGGLPRVGQRSIPAHDCHRGTTGIGRAGLERQS